MTPQYILRAGEQMIDNPSVKVQSNTSTLNIKSLCNEIDLGKAGEGGIRLKPFYQREYKFTKKDESFLIESLLMGIPIPTIYLASDTSVYPPVSNVIDGQHRLRAIHRFINGDFQLVGLEKLKEINKKYFNDLSVELKNKLMVQTSLNINYIHVQDDPSLELEIFLRYNKGTNPMSKQEIRHVLFGSKFNDWVIELVSTLKETSEFSQIFNIVKKRYADKAVHADMFTLFYVYHYGLNEKHVATPYYVDDIMHKAKQMSESRINEFIERSKWFIDHYLDFLKLCRKEGIVHPFSKEIYSPEDKTHHFQSSIMMILTGVYREIIQQSVKIDETNIKLVMTAISEGFKKSSFYGATSATTKYELVNGAVQSITGELRNANLFK